MARRSDPPPGSLSLEEASARTPWNARYTAICNACEHEAHLHLAHVPDGPYACEECGCTTPDQVTWLSERTKALWVGSTR